MPSTKKHTSSKSNQNKKNLIKSHALKKKKQTTAKKIKKTTRQTKLTKPKTKKIVLHKYEQNPIITPSQQNNWEAWQTFNPAAILLNNSIHFLYRAIGTDGISRLGYAHSQDGFHIDQRLNYPVFEHYTTNHKLYTIYSYLSGGSFGGAEDPRIVQINNEDTLYMTYTACDNGLRVGLSSIKLNDFLNKNWKWSTPQLISPPNEIHKNWVIFPEKIHNKYAILTSISPNIQIAYRDSLNFQPQEYITSYYDGFCPSRQTYWDNWVRGAGAPPLKTKLGWLLFYQAMDKNDPGKYKVGAMILDKNNPEIILYRSINPLLEPTAPYENNGYKKGVVYVTGAVIKNNNLFVYYGSADNYVSVAYIKLQELLQALQQSKYISLAKYSQIITKYK
ncbi:MAG: hypothetical protein ACP5IC_01865 [Minisyncoccia bacterium]